MRRKAPRFAPLPVLLLAALAAVGCGSEAPREAAAPRSGTSPPAAPAQVENVLLITIDTLRADALGFAGKAGAETPALDRLAAAGRVFDDAHAHNVVTLPSHANILTGLHPFEHGIRDNSGFVLPESIDTMATLLGGAGFATAAVVGAFPLDARFGLGRGFDLYDDAYPEGGSPGRMVTPERSGSEVVARGLDWWRAQQGSRRFLWLHLFDPHAPYAPPAPFASRFAADPYQGEVAAVDSYLAPLLDPFLSGGEAPTLVVFTADHGEALGDHGELTHGLFAYEATLEVPLVLWAPGIEPARVAAPARHIDLLPTVLAATGVEGPALPGRDLLSTPGPMDGITYFESLSPNLNRGWAPLRGAIRGSDKFISLPLPELYDLAADPGEETNLIEARPRLAREIAAALPAESVWPPARGEVSAEEAAALRSLGYVSGSGSATASFTAADDPKNLVGLDNKMHRVIDFFERRRLDEAAALAREVIAQRPDMGVAYYHLAQALLEQGELAEAIKVMAEARSRGVASQALERQLGLSLAETGRMDEALAVLRPLGESDDPDALNALGMVLAEAGRPAEARGVLERVFRRDPRNPQAHQNLALAALRGERWGEAREQANKALALNDGLGLAWSYLGAAEYNLGRPREALAAWSAAVEREPDLYDAVFNIALVAGEIGDAATARQALERFIANAPPERYGPDIERARAWLSGLPGSG